MYHRLMAPPRGGAQQVTLLTERYLSHRVWTFGVCTEVFAWAVVPSGHGTITGKRYAKS